ncbi:hypothetical protein [Pelagibius sp. Alg239-R121]|uniref:hypothetical protein n=1 Tax=Pelagibius sp. Alg239-R121 TaxID=2993448 RepID=UPI0024A77332|nr:hypothetical protein [Pelagibius sp. Alg239-R121]
MIHFDASTVLTMDTKVDLNRETEAMTDDAKKRKDLMAELIRQAVEHVDRTGQATEAEESFDTQARSDNQWVVAYHGGFRTLLDYLRTGTGMMLQDLWITHLRGYAQGHANNEAKRLWVIRIRSSLFLSVARGPDTLEREPPRAPGESDHRWTIAPGWLHQEWQNGNIEILEA